MTPRLPVSNALDNSQGASRLRLSNALDTPIWGGRRGHPRRGAPPDARGRTLHHEGPARPALRRFRVTANCEEVAMAPE